MTDPFVMVADKLAANTSASILILSNSSGLPNRTNRNYNTVSGIRTYSSWKVILAWVRTQDQAIKLRSELMLDWKNVSSFTIFAEQG